MTRYVRSPCIIPKKIKRKPLQVNVYFLTVLMGIIIVVTGFLYIIQTNSIAVHGYTMEDIEKRVSDLKEQNEYLKLQATELQSIQHIQKKANGLGLIPVDKVEYLSGTASTVATK